ncbi:MAG: thioesterase family protein [Chloroflexota bacterium]
MYVVSKEEKVAILKRTVEEFLPFNKLLKVKYVSADPVKLSVENRPELVGNALRQILHGGVIATLLDVAGGMAIFNHVLETTEFESQADIPKKFGRSGTIDLRVDYIRPGKGQEFFATVQIIRQGNRVSVTRMELHNEEQTLIALGTGTYVV